MGPLSGVKIVELAGIGPGPFAGMLLSDMGADIVRVDRAGAGEPGVVRQAEPRTALPRPPLDRRRPQEPRRGRDRAAARRAGRRADRGLPPRRDRAARPRARRLPRAQPEARLRAHDRLGPGRPDGAGRGPRHQLHRARRRARALRPRRRQAHAADQPRRRLRRRRHVHGVRRRVRHPRGARIGQGPGDRRGDGRRHRDAHVDDVGPEEDRRRGTRSSASTCSTPARRSTTRTRRADGKFISLGSLEPQFYAELLQQLGLDRRRTSPRRWTARAGARCATTFTDAVQDEDARRVGRDPARAPTRASRRCSR